LTSPGMIAQATKELPAHQPRLFKRVLNAGLWTIGAQGTEFATRLLSTLILTRLLFPEAFGLIAAATSLLVGLALISDVGIRTMILQGKNADEERFLRTAWTLQAGRGLGLWLILLLVCATINLSIVREAFPTNSVFANPQFSLITAALGFSLVIGGLESTAVHLNVRRLNFRPIFFLDLVARLSPLPIMIAWAFLAPSVWALIAGALTGGVIRVAISHTFMPGPRMYPQWDRDHVREILGFGKWINVASVATFLSGQSDRLLLGILLPGSTFGLYTIAKTLTETSNSLFDRLHTAITLPVLSEVVRKNPCELKRKYYQFRLPFDLSVPLVGGLLVATGPLIVQILFDQRYHEAGKMVQFLAVALAMFPVQMIGSAFTASGEPYVGAIVSIVRAASLVTCLVAGYLINGMWGALSGIAIHGLIPSTAILIFAHQRGWISVYRELGAMMVFIVGVIIGEGFLLVLTMPNILQFWHD
jgi:O-antigen/teichoic acid export membrane protein